MIPSARYIQFFQVRPLGVLKFFVFSLVACISRLKLEVCVPGAIWHEQVFLSYHTRYLHQG